MLPNPFPGPVWNGLGSIYFCHSSLLLVQILTVTFSMRQSLPLAFQAKAQMLAPSKTDADGYTSLKSTCSSFSGLLPCDLEVADSTLVFIVSSPSFICPALLHPLVLSQVITSGCELVYLKGNMHWNVYMRMTD